MKIGVTIRSFRLQHGLSQGDIERRTGLLRCYLSRVENGHTIPSLETLTKLACALEMPLAQFFADDTPPRQIPAQRVSDEELSFLTQLRRYSAGLNESEKKVLLGMARKYTAPALSHA